jgi:hypothetical protein
MGGIVLLLLIGAIAITVMNKKTPPMKKYATDTSTVVTQTDSIAPQWTDEQLASAGWKPEQIAAYRIEEQQKQH